MDMKNSYLEQVKAQQQVVEGELRANRAPMQASPLVGGGLAQMADGLARVRRTNDANIQPSQAVNIRITGFWRWKTVIVPPNAYVVHTRRNHKDPLHLGLGISFRFNPHTDSFLVVPSTMQTILINADCICEELQGILVQGYVQWIIDDFAKAYKKLDFTDKIDPMRVVNVQLREQAEAAIKDKVATMSIKDVLSDKQPIIQELTARLRQVGEGQGDSDKGLGLRIVTVQIKEAVVSSARLWENLQKPFRADSARIARLAELQAESVVKGQELEHEKRQVTAELENQSELNALRADKEAQTFDREQIEKVRRHHKEQETLREILIAQNITEKQQQQAHREVEESSLAQQILLTKARLDTQHQEFLAEAALKLSQIAKNVETAQARAALDRLQLEIETAQNTLKLEGELTCQRLQQQAELNRQEAALKITNHQTEMELGFAATRQQIHNDTTPSHLQALLVERLPEIMAKMPQPQELRTISINGADSQNSLPALITQILTIVEAFRQKD